MKKISLISAALIASFAASAYAADLPFLEPPPEAAPVLVDWSGLYVGIGGGGGAAVYDTDFNIGAATLNIDGFGGEGWLVEGRLGYDFQFGNWFVLGALADVHWSDIDTEATLTIGGVNVATASLESELGFDVMGRAGALVNDRALLYVLGGWAWQEFEGSASIPGLGIDVSDDEDSDGFTVGAGAEILATDNLSVLLEYRYTQLDEIDFGTGGVVEIDPSLHTARLGVNYKLHGLLGR